MFKHIIKNYTIKIIHKLAYTLNTIIKYSQPLELVIFYIIKVYIKCHKDSHHPYLLNNYLFNYLNSSGLTLFLLVVLFVINQVTLKQHVFKNMDFEIKKLNNLSNPFLLFLFGNFVHTVIAMATPWKCVIRNRSFPLATNTITTNLVKFIRT